MNLNIRRSQIHAEVGQLLTKELPIPSAKRAWLERHNMHEHFLLLAGIEHENKSPLQSKMMKSVLSVLTRDFNVLRLKGRVGLKEKRKWDSFFRRSVQNIRKMDPNESFALEPDFFPKALGIHILAGEAVLGQAYLAFREKQGAAVKELFRITQRRRMN
jgi:G3E family GTPase